MGNLKYVADDMVLIFEDNVDWDYLARYYKGRKNSAMTKDLIKQEMMRRVMSFRPNWIDCMRHESFKKFEKEFLEFNGIKN